MWPSRVRINFCFLSCSYIGFVIVPIEVFLCLFAWMGGGWMVGGCWDGLRPRLMEELVFLQCHHFCWSITSHLRTSEQLGVSLSRWEFKSSEPTGSRRKGKFSLTPSESFLRKSFPFSCFWQKIQLWKEQISLKRKTWQQEAVGRTSVCVVFGVQASRICQVTQHSSAKCMLQILNLPPPPLGSVRKNGTVCYTVGKHCQLLATWQRKPVCHSHVHSCLLISIALDC